MVEPIDEVISRVQRTYGGWRRDTSVEQMRADWDNLFWSDASGLTGEFTQIADVDATWIDPDGGSRDKIFLYLHGGGYKVGSVRSHFDLIAHIAIASGMTGLGIEYSRAPETLFPGQIHELDRVYDALLGADYTPENIAFIGDSAGGNLAISGLLSAKKRGRPLPAALALLSPWTDLTASGKSYVTRAKSDPIHQQKMIQMMAQNYLGDADPADPMASPLYADVSGFPPTLIQVGDRETVLSDAQDFTAKLTQGGVDAQCQTWDGMIHVFQQFPDKLPEAQQAIADIGSFLKKHLKV